MNFGNYFRIPQGVDTVSGVLLVTEYYGFRVNDIAYGFRHFTFLVVNYEAVYEYRSMGECKENYWNY